MDFLTLTVTGDKVTESAWASAAHTFVSGVASMGNKLEARGMQGYNGIMAGGAFIGYRSDGAMLRVSGPIAGEAWESLYNRDITRVTRVDLQVTVWFDREARNLINRAFVQAKKHREAKLTSRKKETFISGGEKGDTAYLGSRTSEIYIRVYDKWRESGDDAYKWAIRYEVEYKGHRAKEIAKTLHETDWTEVAEFVRGQVIGTLAAEGVIMPVDVQAGYYRKIEPAKDTTDTATKLKWLRQQVRPSVEWLLEQGLRAEVMIALGLNVDHHGEHKDEVLTDDTQIV